MNEEIGRTKEFIRFLQRHLTDSSELVTSGWVIGELYVLLHKLHHRVMYSCVSAYDILSLLQSCCNWFCSISQFTSMKDLLDIACKHGLLDDDVRCYARKPLRRFIWLCCVLGQYSPDYPSMYDSWLKVIGSLLCCFHEYMNAVIANATEESIVAMLKFIGMLSTVFIHSDLLIEAEWARKEK